MTKILGDEFLHRLRRLDACALANAIESFDARLRNEGFVNHTVRSLFPELAPMVGHAATVRIRGSSPPTVGCEYPEKTYWLDYLSSLPSPRVVVIQDTATQPGLCSLIGEVLIALCRSADFTLEKLRAFFAKARK
jgi:regulator of RNase E activity RraA